MNEEGDSGLWIKSQDDEVLINLERVAALKHHNFYGDPEDHGPVHGIVAFVNGGENHDFELGRYYNAQRVEEVLEEIEDEIEKGLCDVYYMPLE